MNWYSRNTLEALADEWEREDEANLPTGDRVAELRAALTLGGLHARSVESISDRGALIRIMDLVANHEDFLLGLDDAEYGAFADAIIAAGYTRGGAA